MAAWVRAHAKHEELTEAARVHRKEVDASRVTRKGQKIGVKLIKSRGREDGDLGTGRDSYREDQPWETKR